MYPMSALTEAVGSFRGAFPYTPLRLYVEVARRRHRAGVAGNLPHWR